MLRTIRGIRGVLNRNIFVGERLNRNLRNICVASGIVMLLGLVMTLINGLQLQLSMTISSFSILLVGAVSLVSAGSFKRRTPAVVVTTLAIVVVLTYDLLFADNHFAYLWTLMVPLAFCYLASVKIGLLLTLYFELLLVVLFYTPLRGLVAAHYSEIVMDRFPLLYFFHGVMILFVMYQYQKSVIFELEHADKLNEEVERQTAVAAERSRRIEQMSLQTIQTLANAIDAKDPCTKGHSSRVSQYSVKIAEVLGWNEERVNDLRYSSLLHDIGKIGVPDSILNNPKRLTDVEYGIIKSHTTMGGDILHGKIMIGMAEDVARNHHEWYNGSGYPRGVRGADISEEARIVAISDAFDAMSSNRVYRKACEPDHIRKELIEGKGKQFDPKFTDVLLKLWDSGALDEILTHDTVEEDSAMEESSALLQEVMEAFVSKSTADVIDTVTGIMTRAAGEAAISQVMKEECGCFVFFDMDNLKRINDMNGHFAGDRALRLVGETFRANSANALFCRLGGDEFLGFIKDVSAEEAEKRVAKIIREYEDKTRNDAQVSAASLSAGLVMCTPVETYASAYNKADKALYHVKQNGKNGLSFFHDSADGDFRDHVDMDKLINGITASGSYDGALDVEFRQFAQLYDYICNLEKRFAHPFELMMIMLDPGPDETPRSEDLERAMYFMEQAIRQTIRNVDIITRYNRQQFLVILLGTDLEGSKIAADRIFRSYYKMNGSGSFAPAYTVADLGKH